MHGADRAARTPGPAALSGQAHRSKAGDASPVPAEVARSGYPETADEDPSSAAEAVGLLISDAIACLGRMILGRNAGVTAQPSAATQPVRAMTQGGPYVRLWSSGQPKNDSGRRAPRPAWPSRLSRFRSLLLMAL
jgi:hypothetical protein